MASERCVVCDLTEAETSAADYLFRLRVFNTSTRSAHFADVHLRCIGAFLVDRHECLMQCTGRVKDINEADRVARVLAKRAQDEAAHTFEEPFNENQEDHNSGHNARLSTSSTPEGISSNASK